MYYIKMVNVLGLIKLNIRNVAEYLEFWETIDKKGEIGKWFISHLLQQTETVMIESHIAFSWGGFFLTYQNNIAQNLKKLALLEGPVVHCIIDKVRYCNTLGNSALCHLGVRNSATFHTCNRSLKLSWFYLLEGNIKCRCHFPFEKGGWCALWS